MSATSGNRRGSRARRVGRPSQLFTPAEIADLIDRLAATAEAVCRRYLSNGRRQGGYWIVGDLANSPGRSLFVRLKAGRAGPAGKFTDAATGEHGDLLDIIRETQQLRTFPEAVREARRFLGLPDPAREAGTALLNVRRRSPGRPPDDASRRTNPQASSSTNPSSTIAAARRLFAASVPIAGTLAELYLQRRGITGLVITGALRFHARCFYRLDEDDELHDPPEVSDDAAVAATRSGPPHRFLPALIAAVTDEAGAITGVQRTYLDVEALASDAPLGPLLGKASVPSPRRALGELLGHGVRFGAIGPGPAEAGIAAAGEGVETMLSLRMALPGLPAIAALSAGHLGALQLPPGLLRLYIAEDADPAGRAAMARLAARAEAAGIEAVVLKPMLDDVNGDLRAFGLDALRQHLRPQLAPQDVGRLLLPGG
jgi:hypothetical protein